LKTNNIETNIINIIGQNVDLYTDNQELQNYPIEEKEIEEIPSIIEQIIEKLYKEWMAREKTKIRYNSAVDAKGPGIE
jgi:hypothetical protein